MARFQSNPTYVNLLANWAGRGSGLLANLVATPIYLHLLGYANYGLVTFAVSLNVIAALFDFGLGLGINREMAALASADLGGHRRGLLLGSVEMVYWILALLVGGLVYLSRGVIAERWLAADFNPSNAGRVIGLAACWLLLQMPYAIYHGALSGSGRQLSLNVVLGACNVLRPVVSVGALSVVSEQSRLSVFFCSQITLAAVQTLALRWMAWRSIAPAGGHPFRADFKVVRPLFNSLSIAAALWLALSLLDLVLLSRYVGPAELGAYGALATLAILPASLGGPLNVALLPTLTRLLAEGSVDELRREIRRGFDIVFTWILPLSLVLIFMSQHIVYAWSNDAAFAMSAPPVVALLSIGYTLYAILMVPYSLMIARKRTAFFSVGCAVAVVLSGCIIGFGGGTWGVLAGALAVAVSYLWLVSIALQRNWTEVGGALLASGRSHLFTPWNAVVVVLLALLSRTDFSGSRLAATSLTLCAMFVVYFRLLATLVSRIQNVSR